jgi:hypothetical protein
MTIRWEYKSTKISEVQDRQGTSISVSLLVRFDSRCVLGFQSIAQVSATYGRGEADTIVENCGNTLILRCSASEGGGT